MSQNFEPFAKQQPENLRSSKKPAPLSFDTLERITQESRKTFLQEEAPELLQTLLQGFEKLKIGDLSHQGQHYLTLIRAAHSFKGGASTAQLPILTQLAHQLEDVLEIFKNQSFPEPKLIYELLRQTVNLLEQLVLQEVSNSTLESLETILVQDFQQSYSNDLIAIQEFKNKLKNAPKPIINLIQVLEKINIKTNDNEQTQQNITTPQKNPLLERAATESSLPDSKNRDLNEQPLEVKPADQASLLDQKYSSSLEQRISKIPDKFLQYIVIQPENITKKTNLKVQMPIARLDRMSNMMGDLLVSHEKLTLHQTQLNQSNQNLKKQTQKLLPIQDNLYILTKHLTAENQSEASLRQTDSTHQLTTDVMTHLKELQELMMQVQETRNDVDLIVREQQNTLDQLRSSLDDLNQDLKESRLVPFKSLMERFRASISLLSEQYHKSVDLVIQGAETLIDQAILQQLQTPINHLVRNAFAHGIELPAEREAVGKSPTAKITLSATIQGHNLVLKVADDGRGIDLQKVYQHALEREVIHRNQSDLLGNSILTNAEILELLFTPGFSTSSTVNDLSGRGVGLDVVRYEVGQLRGTMQVETQLGIGTQFIMIIPLTLSIVRLLLCRCGQQLLAIPSTNVLEIISLSEISPSAIYKNTGDWESLNQENQGDKILWQDQLVPLFPLIQLMPYHRLDVMSATPALPPTIILILEMKGEQIAVGVDALYQERDLVLKSFDSTVSVPAYISGCTVLGTGEVVPVLSPHHFETLILQFQKSKTLPEFQDFEIQSMSMSYPQISPTASIYPSKSTKKELTIPSNLPIPSILVVDDSITVRRSLDYLLSQAGYQITQCCNGKEAVYELHKLGRVFDLVISDLEMPRLNGLGLLHEIRNHPDTKYLPVMMLTSRQSERYRRQLLNAGATDFLGKPWEPNQLLELVAKWLLET